MRWQPRRVLRFFTPSNWERRSRNPLSFWPPILLAMVILLAIIANLQYRWSSEATGAHEFRVGSELESRMIRWHLDLYREFSAICVALQVGPDSGAHDTWRDYLQRYVNWNRGEKDRTSFVNLYSNPDLVSAIYIWETSRNTPRLLQFNAQKQSIDSSTVPEELAPLLSHLRASSADLATALRAWKSGELGQDRRWDDINGDDSLRSAATTGWQFDPTVPLIAHPIVRHDDSTPVDWILVVLNREVIESRTLPELVKRHFGTANGLDFKVAVVSVGQRLHVIYSSEPGFGTQGPAAYDSVMNLFGPPPESVEAQFWQTVKDTEFLRSGQWRSFSSPVWLPTIEYGSAQNSWILVVQSEHGPLQAVVQKAKFRNLAISALVLILLALNMGVATVAGLRAQRFADLQMNFVASISHELRTPLSVLHSAAENIKDGLVRERSLARYGHLMISQTRQLMSHVDRIMLFASIRSGKARYTMRPVQAAEIIQRVVIDTEDLVKENKCTLVSEVEPDLPCVRGDIYAIRSCVENLVTNAIKYSDKDRHVRISAARARRSEGPDEVWIRVEDSGIGISRSDLSNIFQPFYRSPVAIAAQIHGTGLGLFVAKHIAEAMGGKLAVTSEVGVGTVFTLQLSVCDPTEDTAPVVLEPYQEVTSDAREHFVDRG